jgi:hypothetical protein
MGNGERDIHTRGNSSAMVADKTKSKIEKKKKKKERGKRQISPVQVILFK